MPRSSDRGDGAAILLRDVHKSFYFYEHRTASMREWFIRSVLRRPIRVGSVRSALSGVDLRIEPGEAVGLIGGNGSGKSTLLRLIAGIYRSSAGTVRIRGRLSAVLELGAGFHPELSGEENLRIYATVLGMSRRELESRYAWIVGFADLGDVLGTPMKYYSTGMRARLATAVALGVEPDILLLDEVLAVGDQVFFAKCLERIREHHGRGRTLVVVSHQLDLLAEICPRIVWLEQGCVLRDGEAAPIVAEYREKALAALRAAQRA